MDYIINKYTLKFKDQAIELQYQLQTYEKSYKPLFYIGLFLTLILNVLQFVVRATSTHDISMINVTLVALTLINIVIFKKKEKYIQLSMTLLNACALLLQLNFVDPDPTKQEYYAYGSMLATLQTCLCFFTDFSYGCPSIVIHIGFRLVASAYISGYFNITLLLLSLMCLVFLISVLYICNKAQRLQFLLNFKDEAITNQLETLINAPFSKIKYDDDQLKIDVQIAKQIDKLICYQAELCPGCNIRNFLRSTFYSDISLESGIINQTIPLNQSIIAIQNNDKIKLRLCQYSIDNSIIIISEYFVEKEKCNKIPTKMKQSLNQQFTLGWKTFSNKQFNYGVISLLMMNQKETGTIDLIKLLNQLRGMYSYLATVRIIYLKNIKLKTYPYLFKIFIIQIFNILEELQGQRNTLDEIEFINCDESLIMKLKIKAIRPFLIYYHQNFFIEQSSQLLLLWPLTKDLNFYFNKSIPFKKPLDQT